MVHSGSKKFIFAALAFMLAFAGLLIPSSRINAADHAESSRAAEDPSADLADVFAFLDPNDNTKVILAMDVEGFIVPSELGNIGLFSPHVTYRFEIENTGDAKPDLNIDITFSKQTSRSEPQTATIKLPGNKTFTAKTTVANERATGPVPFVVTSDPATNVKFFAGLTDDPFYFDIIGFNRFVASVRAGSPDPKALQRGRDSFAGYNIHMIVLSVPVSMLKGSGNIIGVDAATFRDKKVTRLPNDEEKGKGGLIQIDRMGNPAINTVLIPYPRKNEYNDSTSSDDATGKFANDIIATLKVLGTNDTNINILAGVAVLKGDMLRLDVSKPNKSLGEGESVFNTSATDYSGYPNGRRFGDDTIDTTIFFVVNQNKVGDNVNKNDVPLAKEFPYVAPAHQGLENPAVDGTQN